MSSTALVLATASDTAPMAILPQRIGSGGSAGITGFSAEVSILPEKKKIDKRLLSRKQKCDYDKTVFFNVLLTDAKAEN